jgi:hypothetical protein
MKDDARPFRNHRRKDLVMGEIALNNLTTGDVSLGDLDHYDVVYSVGLETLY